jgi:hypothetical protein
LVVLCGRSCAPEGSCKSTVWIGFFFSIGILELTSLKKWKKSERNEKKNHGVATVIACEWFVIGDND